MMWDKMFDSSPYDEGEGECDDDDIDGDDDDDDGMVS